jgi:foldase protein PrsA
MALAGCKGGQGSASSGAANPLPPRTGSAAVSAAPTSGPATLPAGGQASALPADQVVARVNGQAITRQQLQAPLMEAYGLNVLLNLVQLEMVKQQAARANIVVTPDDIRQERQTTLDKLFQESNQPLLDKLDDAVSRNDQETAASLREQIQKDNEQFLDQFLQRQHISATEFAIVLETNTYLRKIAAPMLAGKITEQNLQEAFGVLYGENIKVRHIQLANLQEVAEAQRRLAEGQPFEKVAETMSQDRETAGLGGELPAFSRSSPSVPENYKQVAFSLKPGEVSEPVQARNNYYLIKLEQKMAPKAVKFEDVKESVRQQLYDRWLQSTVNQLRQRLGQEALQSLQIEDPVLKQQFVQRLGQRQAEARDREHVRRELEQARLEAEARNGGPATAPTTQQSPAPVAPSTAPAADVADSSRADQPATPVAPAPTADDAAKSKAADARPPATMSGSSTPDQPKSSVAEPATQPAQ